MAGDQQLRAFIERILRLKEEQDALAADIREVYAEAKGSGFDKTAMGQLVAHLRKVEKVGVAAVEEGQTVFDTYLDAYRRATGTALVVAHTHEDFQAPRSASLGDQRDAYRAGSPISQDFRFEKGTVYFVAFRGIGRIKIGVSGDAAQRIADLEKACGDQAEVLALMPGNRQAELAAHRHHAEWQVAGEWYQLCDAALAAITAYTATHTHEATQSYAEQKGRGFVAGLTDEQRAAALAYDGDDTHGEITEHEQPETAYEMDRATEGSFEAGSEAAGKGRKATATVAAPADLSHAGADESSATPSNPQPTSSPEADKTGEAVPPPYVSPVALSDDDVPAFIKKDKDGCLKLKDGHCRISFATSALCSECNAARSKARAGA